MAVNTQTIGAPGVNNDSSQGFSVGSTWRDIVAGRVYVCQDATGGAAVWQQVSVDASTRTLPVDPDAAIVRSPSEAAVLQDVLKELTAIRYILSSSFNIDIKPEDLG